MKKIGLLNGPNLDRLGKREPDIYGSETLEEILQKTQSLGTTLGCEVHAFQSNHEGALIDVERDFLHTELTVPALGDVLQNNEGLGVHLYSLSARISRSPRPSSSGPKLGSGRRSRMT